MLCVRVRPNDDVCILEDSRPTRNASCQATGQATHMQPLPGFIEKIIQLYEMIVVRHGLMIVGDSFGMKTCMYRTLAILPPSKFY